MFHEHLRRKCILLLLDGMSYKYEFSPSCLMCHLKLVFPYLFSFGDLSIGESQVLESLTVIVLLLISSFMAVSICLMY